MTIAAGGERHLLGVAEPHPEPPSSSAGQEGDGWRRVESLLALAGTVLIGMRVNLPHLLTLGDVLAFLTLPLWLALMWRNKAARSLLILGVAAVPIGALLSWTSAEDHTIRLGSAADASILMLGLVASLGFLLWARQRLEEGALVSYFGLGLLLGVSPSDPLFPSNPWKFGFALPIAVLLLGLLGRARFRGLELAAIGTLAIVSAVTDARSSFAILVLTAALLAWQRRPQGPSRRASAARAVLGMTLGAAVTYVLAQSLILNGLLGPETQQRSIEQVHQSGSLILGGRPEIAATLTLMWAHPLGLGSGTVPSYADIATAKQGMDAVGYDPQNGYVEHWMFGYTYRLHSMVGDLWAQFGLVGLAFAALVFIFTLRRLGEVVATRTASAAFCFVAVLTLWNVFFAPWYSGLKVLALALTLALMARTRLTSPSGPRQPSS